MPTTSINGIRLNWELNGDSGDPVVLVHGSWGDHRNWAPVVPRLSRSFRVLTYDRRGHSGSERPEGPGSVREDVADLAALIEQLGHFPAHIIGNSFGASIVLRLAGERPELFRSLIVHEPPLFGLLKDEPDAQSALAAVRERITAVVETLTAGDFTGGARQFVETIAFGPGAWPALPQATRDIFVFNASTWLDEVRDPEALEIDLSRLRNFTASVLLTVGGQSPPFFPLVVGRIAGALAQAERQTFAEAGHVPHLSHAEEYVRVVTSFIQHAAGPKVSEQPTFKSLEHDGWSERAAGYDDYTARITNFGIAPLLDAADIGPGQRVLDVCCGTGLIAAAAVHRGASVVGIDISEDMVAIAAAKGMAATFGAGDAEALPFDDASFDRVICNFGLYHLPDPDRAIAEAARVLRPGGRYAFTTWCGPDVSPLFRIIPEAIKAHGAVDVGLPPAPPAFRLADRAESTGSMQAAGFGDIAFDDFRSILECPLDGVIEFLQQGTVRMTMVLRAQTAVARSLIEQSIRESLAAYAQDGILRLPMPAIVASGTLE